MRKVNGDRIRREAALMMGPSATTYTVAKIVGVNQSTVWRDVAIRLRSENQNLWAKVQVILQDNRRNVKKVPMDKASDIDYNRSVNR